MTSPVLLIFSACGKALFFAILRMLNPVTKVVCTMTNWTRASNGILLLKENFKIILVSSHFLPGCVKSFVLQYPERSKTVLFPFDLLWMCLLEGLILLG
jgi:hypothetical protein